MKPGCTFLMKGIKKIEDRSQKPEAFLFWIQDSDFWILIFEW